MHISATQTLSYFLLSSFLLPNIFCFLPTPATLNRLSFSAKVHQSQLRMSVIVGKGRIGNALYEMGNKKDILVGRFDEIPLSDGPIYVCTRNDDLENVINRTPESKRSDLVFVQNGIIGPYLSKFGLEDNTQVLIYFAVSKKGERPVDGITDTNPDGLTSVTGKWALELKERLAAGNLVCHILEKDKFLSRAFEKHIWICSFMLVGVAHAATVGEVESMYHDEVCNLIAELVAASTNDYSTAFEDGVVERLCAYARTVAHYPTAIKEWEWRNGFFWNVSKRAVSRGVTDPLPLHTELLKKCQLI